MEKCSGVLVRTAARIRRQLCARIRASAANPHAHTITMTGAQYAIVSGLALAVGNTSENGCATCAIASESAGTVKWNAAF